MLSDFLKYIEENHMIRKGDNVLMAVSGGIDSMVMAHLFIKSNFRTSIAHCNFCLRGKESDKDEELVKKYAADNNIPFFSRRFDTKGYAARSRISIQMAARDLRYRWFEEIRKKNGFNKIAIGHNLNDNIETLLINLTRGTGITGLTGMKPSGHYIIRPLLFATRDRIQDYCIKNRIRYREDRSNAETKYTRNRIRHLVIPVLKDINPSIEFTLHETTERISGINEIVTIFIEKLKQKALTERDGDMVLKLSPLRPYLDNTSILYELTKSFGMTNNLLKDLRNIITGQTGGYIFTDTHRILKNRNELILSARSNRGKEDIVPCKINRIADIRKVSFIKSISSVNITRNFRIPSDDDTACLDYARVKFPLIIRKWKPGDSFYPLGMKKKKKLSDYFTDRKYSIPEKEKAYILESAGKIAWIVGERIDDRFRITPETKRALIIKAQRLNETKAQR
jgi:tRNA(Ile)-lysidine synthase